MTVSDNNPASASFPDEDGNWSVVLDISSEEDCVLSLTARSDAGSSLPLTLYVTSPITAEMMQECADILDELDEYLAEEGYEDSKEYDAEALELAANWLEMDERVASVSRGESMTLFVTNDHVTGGCMLPSEEGTFGTSDNDYESYQTESISVDLYKQWNDGIDLYEVGQYVNGYNTATNNNVLILSPLYSSEGEFEISYGNYISVLSSYGSEYLNEAGAVEKKNVNALEYLFTSYGAEISNYGIIIMNTHGWKYTNEDDGSAILCTKLWASEDNEKWNTLLGYESIRVGSAEVNYKYFYTDEGRDGMYTRTRLVMASNGIYALSNFYMSLWQNTNTFFDNTIFYFGICYGLCDDEFNDFLVSHGAIAVIGYTQTIDSNVERMRFESFFSKLLSEGDDQAYHTIAEATTSNYGIINGICTGILRIFQPNILPRYRGDQKLYVYSARDDFTLYGYGTLSGTVELSEKAEVLEEDYSVAGATVAAYRYLRKNFVLQKRTTTAQDGSFSFSDLEYGVYAITVEEEDFRTLVTGVVYENQSQDGGTIYLTPDTNLVKGTVLDDSSGDPVADAIVVCSGYDGSSQTATTDKDGVYKFKKLDTGEYILFTLAEGYYQFDKVKFTVKSDSFLITPEDIYVKRAVEVSGYVYDEEGTPLSGVQVSVESILDAYLWSEAVQTDSGGFYQIEVFGVNDYTLNYSLDGYISVENSFTVTDSIFDGVQDGNPVELENVVLEREADGNGFVNELRLEIASSRLESADRQKTALSRLMSLDSAAFSKLELSDVYSANWNFEGANCIAELPSDNIRMYGYYDDEVYFTGVAFDIDGEICYFDWCYTSGTRWSFQLYWNEKTQQLQVTCPVYYGTGLYAPDLYIVQKDENGTWVSYRFGYEEYSKALENRLTCVADAANEFVTIIDRQTGEAIASDVAAGSLLSMVDPDQFYYGNVSSFDLGETIVYTCEWISDYNGAFGLDAPNLQFELILNTDENGDISFELGNVRAVY